MQNNENSSISDILLRIKEKISHLPKQHRSLYNIRHMLQNDEDIRHMFNQYNIDINNLDFQNFINMQQQQNDFFHQQANLFNQQVNLQNHMAMCHLGFSNHDSYEEGLMQPTSDNTQSKTSYTYHNFSAKDFVGTIVKSAAGSKLGTKAGDYLKVLKETSAGKAAVEKLEALKAWKNKVATIDEELASLNKEIKETMDKISLQSSFTQAEAARLENNAIYQQLKKAEDSVVGKISGLAYEAKKGGTKPTSEIIDDIVKTAQETGVVAPKDVRIFVKNLQNGKYAEALTDVSYGTIDRAKALLGKSDVVANNMKAANELNVKLQEMLQQQTKLLNDKQIAVRQMNKFKDTGIALGATAVSGGAGYLMSKNANPQDSLNTMTQNFSIFDWFRSKEEKAPSVDTVDQKVLAEKQLNDFAALSPTHSALVKVYKETEQYLPTFGDGDEYPNLVLFDDNTKEDFGAIRLNAQEDLYEYDELTGTWRIDNYASKKLIPNIKEQLLKDLEEADYSNAETELGWSHEDAEEVRTYIIKLIESIQNNL
ncbi:MAG: hypothetical protein MJZ34_03015 [Paludibacteraceae bacterium]|nr:hypothetical protein [Paludibacteraceae bacterium]